MSILIKKPSKCSEREIEDFVHLVKKGGEVTISGLKDRIKRAKLLAFYYEKDELIGIVGLKTPDDSHRKRIFNDAGVPEAAEEYLLEIGWAYTNPVYRGRRVCTILLDKILSESGSLNLYSTVRACNSPMLTVLNRSGFRKTGNSYRGRKQSLIDLFVRSK